MALTRNRESQRNKVEKIETIANTPKVFQVEETIATMHIAKGPVKFDLMTKNLSRSYETINLELISGPFRHLSGCWGFTDIAQEDAHNIARGMAYGSAKCMNQSIVEFKISFQFSNKLFALALEPVFMGIADTIVELFAQRARIVYGVQK